MFARTGRAGCGYNDVGERFDKCIGVGPMIRQASVGC
jgi:hypothetical protein